MTGTVFSIEEFSVYDGPGIRTTVFMKGCPMRCNWCHNPEGLSPKQEIVRSPNGCVHCGACERICPTKRERCTGCGACLNICPRNLIRRSGKEWTAEALTKKLSKNLDILNSNGGGITFSGGECTMQAEFLTDMLERLHGKTNLAIQTCGYCEEGKFAKILSLCDYVMFDLKVMDEELAKKFTGRGISLILKNYAAVAASGKQYMPRIPLIPEVTDTEENINRIIDVILSHGGSEVELLPYNPMSGSKYALVGKQFRPMFNESVPPQDRRELFEARGVSVKIY